MIITMTSTHINTLCKLKEIAEQHNCIIRFGTTDHFNDSPDLEDFKPYFEDLTDEIIEDINETLEITRRYDKSSSFWFELYEKETDKINQLVYAEIEMLIEYKEPYRSWSLKDETRDFFSVNESWEWALCKETTDQRIHGFEGVDTTEINVYREGMALKFFGDLVCDYLGEERIKEVY